MAENMTRIVLQCVLACDEVQSLPPGRFRWESLSLCGRKSETWILECRLVDSIEGEQRRADFQYHLVRKSKNKSGSTSTIMYHCAYGPCDWRKKYQLFTLLGFDKFQNDMPLVWAIMQRHMHGDLVQVLTVVKEWVLVWMSETNRSHCVYSHLVSWWTTPKKNSQPYKRCSLECISIFVPVARSEKLVENVASKS